MRRRSLATTLAISLVALAGTSLGVAQASAAPALSHGEHIAPHGARVISHRTGLPIGTLPTHGQLSRVARANAAAARNSTLQQNATINPHLTYNGGPVVSSVQVQPVLWGSGTYIPQVDGSVSPNMHTFLQSITRAPYPGWLSEYNTPLVNGTGQRIGAGSVLSSAQITPASPANGTTIYDAQIQQELFNQIVNGALPQPTVDAQNLENTTYVLYFPAGVNICQDSQLTQCSGYPPGNPTGTPVFCGYHGSFGVLNSSNQKVADVRYVVLPAPDSLWQSGCTTNTANTAATGLEAVASHELAEVITDPEVGEASSFGPPLGWYDGSNGEIADICDTLQTEHTTALTGTDGAAYVLENLWSNRVGACGIATAPTAATNLVAAPAAGGTISVRWSAPGIGGGAPVRYDIYQAPSGQSPAMVATTTATSWTSAALPSGSSYSFSVQAVSDAGSATSTGPVSATADATAPAVSNGSGPAAFTLAGSATFGYRATDADSPNGITYDVAYKSAAWNGSWGSLTMLTHGSTATTASLPVRPGREYCVVVRARDTAGNVSRWSSPRCTSSPLDDRSLTTKTAGWSRILNSSAYHGTLTRTTKAGSKLAVTGAIANRLAMVVETCATCGNLQIYLGNTLWKTISTKSSTAHYKHIVVAGSFSLRTTSIVLRAASGVIVVDGLGLARPAPTF